MGRQNSIYWRLSKDKGHTPWMYSNIHDVESGLVTMLGFGCDINKYTHLEREILTY